uniref:guanylate cyclase n=1 Tax=Culicoides sonorensis TaxID=179676 RepID=A0A336MPC9_CULSO
MACPFSALRTRQASVVSEAHNWAIEEDVGGEDDSLTLKHLNAAIQLLTVPSNEDILAAVQSLKANHGNKWPVLQKIKSEKDVMSIYPHYDFLADIQETLLQYDEASSTDILIQLGKELISVSCVGLIKSAFQCLGADLQEFLGSLDGVYDVLKLQEEDLTDTGFVCAGEGELIFITERPVIAWLLLGSLQALCKTLYDAEPKIDMEPIGGHYRYLFTGLEEQKTSLPSILERTASPLSSDLKMSNATFCKAFPWHFIMNEELEFLQLGKGFSRLFKNYIPTYGRNAVTYFKFRRPRNLELKFHEITKRTNTTFLLSVRAPPGCTEFFGKGLEIKGQMVFCPESNSLLFLGSPFLDGLEGLTVNGLFISDIPLHDATREVILVGEQSRAQDGLRRRMDKLKSSIEEANVEVNKERQKNIELLQLIFPADIAKRLWLGDKIDAKPYSDVTLLFSDIVGFTRICSTATPLQVVTMLEKLYRRFDEFCGYFDVYKVETIGDAYCVASGLHRQGDYEAHRVAWMGLSMINACKNYNTHLGEDIQMRIGLHTGTVLAGVVGMKMPRYCLFGHNVTIANKFESGSVACKVNVSPTTKEWLTKYPGFNFLFTPREPEALPKEYQRNEGETCYFLDGYKHEEIDINMPLQLHISQAMKTILDRE